jgi:hypothetical protein
MHYATGPRVNTASRCLARPAPRRCPPGPAVARSRLSAARAGFTRVPPPATVARQRRRLRPPAGVQYRSPELFFTASGAPLSPQFHPPCVARLPAPSAAFPPPPFKRVSLPSPLAFLPSPRPTLPRTTPMCPRALPSSYRPPDTVRSTAIASPSSNSIVAPPCPPSPVRTAARTHPSTFLPFNSSPSPTPPSH